MVLIILRRQKERERERVKERYCRVIFSSRKYSSFFFGFENKQNSRQKAAKKWKLERTPPPPKTRMLTSIQVAIVLWELKISSLLKLLKKVMQMSMALKEM